MENVRRTELLAQPNALPTAEHVRFRASAVARAKEPLGNLGNAAGRGTLMTAGKQEPE
jgi:hypothetical protein